MTNSCIILLCLLEVKLKFILCIVATCQCLRRFFEEKDNWQGLNGLKYFATIVAVTTRTAYSRSHSNGWKAVAWIASIIAAVSSTYWDLVLDWGLLDRKSKNRWLRDKLVIPHKSVYFIAMVSSLSFLKAP